MHFADIIKRTVCGVFDYGKDEQLLNHWKAKRKQVVISIKVETRTQTESQCNQRDDATQFDQQNSHDQSQNTPHSEVVQKGDTFLYIRSLTKIYLFLYLIYVERIAENTMTELVSAVLASLTLHGKHNIRTLSINIKLICTCSKKKRTFEWVSEWVLFNPNSAIFQLYHGENKLIFNEMMMISTRTHYSNSEPTSICSFSLVMRA